jgi:hypothetical protein
MLRSAVWLKLSEVLEVCIASIVSAVRAVSTSESRLGGVVVSVLTTGPKGSGFKLGPWR